MPKNTNTNTKSKVSKSSKNKNNNIEDTQYYVADTPEYVLDTQYYVADTTEYVLDDKSSIKELNIDTNIIDDESDEDQVQVLDDDNTDKIEGEESDNESEQSTEDQNHDKKKDKKHKESFESLTKRIDISRNNIKLINKEINELEKILKLKHKERNDYVRQLNNTLKLIGKTHSDEVTKARKEKRKRKGNINGGFNKEQPVPENLRNFLGLSEDAAIPRPKVMHELHVKFKELGLKDGQIITINKATCEALNLKYSEGKVIKFTEFQTFLASFYPTPVPKSLITFLELSENALMPRLKVMDELDVKFKKLGLNNGKNITINKATLRALNLNDDEEKVINFTEFQTFVTSFYPTPVKAEIELTV
jgi:hypothetical protein